MQTIQNSEEISYVTRFINNFEIYSADSEYKYFIHIS